MKTAKQIADEAFLAKIQTITIGKGTAATAGTPVCPICAKGLKFLGAAVVRFERRPRAKAKEEVAFSA